MIKSNIEDFKIGKCPCCESRHILKVNVYRNTLPNDINKDVRVPIFKQIKAQVRCPSTLDIFEMDLMLQEDVYSQITKITKI